MALSQIFYSRSVGTYTKQSKASVWTKIKTQHTVVTPLLNKSHWPVHAHAHARIHRHTQVPLARCHRHIRSHHRSHMCTAALTTCRQRPQGPKVKPKTPQPQVGRLHHLRLNKQAVRWTESTVWHRALWLRIALKFPLRSVSVFRNASSIWSNWKCLDPSMC